MVEHSRFSVLGMHMVDDFLIVPVNVEIDDDYAMRLRGGILKKVKKDRPKGVLVDASAVRFLDAFTFSLLADTVRMISMLGAGAVLVGLQAGVVSALVDLDIDMENIQTAVTMDDGFDLLRRVDPPEAIDGKQEEPAAPDAPDMKEIIPDDDGPNASGYMR